jgi:hypothetical protein
MLTRIPKWLLATTVLLVALNSQVPRATAQIASLKAPPGEQDRQVTKEDGWIVERDDQTGLTVRTRELTVYPKGEPQPALKYQLIPDKANLLGGNAAIYYLKALGFLEQNIARERLTEFHQQASRQAQEEGKEYHEVPPEAWRSMAPAELPLDEVKKYLNLTSFQPPLLREAARRERFDLDRNLRDVDNPLGYLLPEIQTMRELARTQALRCRLAMAEGRTADALAILGQQYAMARHLGQDEFLVSNLVGIAIAAIAWNDVLYLIQQPDSPNLYWAFTALPTPLVDLRNSLATERELLYGQLKVLREVDQTPRPAGYWQDFLDRLIVQIGYLHSEFNLPSVEDDPQLVRAALVSYIAAAYPGAETYLIQECGLTPEQVAAYPTAQVVFLAIVRFYDQWRDEYFKWTHLPVWQIRTKTDRGRVDAALRSASKRYGFCAVPANLLLPAVLAVRTAEARCEQTIALTRTVEAIRMYGAAHENNLPPSLDDLPVPAPIEPFTGEPIEYSFHGDHAIVTGHPLPGMRYRLVVRFADGTR